ncbi:MAG: single-stranded-DNA-specific exonuclease RecJ, partial [Desulfovibrio sp.]
MPKRWTTPPATPLPPQAAQWADALSISPFLAQLLWQRGLDSAEAMDLFLNPGLSRLPQPTELPGLDQAAGHLAASLGSNARIAVWGDYDVDGVTSSALLLDFFQQREIEAQAYLPHRSEEGYGLNIPGIELLAKQGVGLLLTVDCGVSDIEPIARARELGMDVIVTDHHLPGDQAPDVCAMVNPKLGPCNVPGLTDLAGVGVAFYLAAALNRRLPGEPLDMREFLDLVALGSLADVVPLTNVNRILVKNGLLKISEAKRPGIAALKEVAGFTAGADLNSTQVVFGLGPRINAAGRLDDARSALDLLLSPDMVTARPYAENLNQMNKARRKIEDEIHSEALEQAQNILTDDSRAGLVLYAPHWRSGVVGIVASRVVEAMYRPTLILCDDNGSIKGSGRSIPECNIHQAITQCADLCAHFGGHHQAAGLTLADPDHLAPLMDR